MVPKPGSFSIDFWAKLYVTMNVLFKEKKQQMMRIAFNLLKKHFDWKHKNIFVNF